MTFKLRPYDPDRIGKQTDAQRAATMRNFHIFKLRGLWSQAGMLDEPQRSTVRALIDFDLVKRGALSQADHERERHRKLHAKREREWQSKICSDCGERFAECVCIPF